MPIGPFGEILGTTGTLEHVSEQAVAKYKSKVVAPRNPKLVKGQQNEFKMKPSQYMFQMSLPTEKKLANMHTMNVPKKIELLDMSETSHQKASSINIDEPMFQPFPSEMFFQNFVPFETYEIPLTLRNNDQVPRLVKVTQRDSPYFKIISPSNVGHKVGPGLPTTFILQFTPEDKKDYYHELVCTTERERFIVPVRAIGARGILDFPDDIHFPPAPVKYLSSKTLLVRNVGDRDCKFSLSTEKPFSVTPSNGLIPVNDSLQIVVEFHPVTSGDHQNELTLHYDTGEDVYISLYGAAQDANVRLDKNSIRIENTYISMANERTVTIQNRSDVIAHYKWTQFATQEEEELQKIMFSNKLQDEKKTEEDRFLDECMVDPSLRDKMSILSRTFSNRQRQVESDRLLYNDEVFKIEPVEGDIWPNSTADISVVFKPREPQTYTRTVFCDVTGRESRLPLRIRGDGIGPSVQFSFDEVDIGNIFINSQHIYEVVLANKGDIDAIFSLIPSNTVFGPCFQFNPSEGIVMPDGHQAIQVTFSSAVLGDFCEEFSFQIDGSPENLKLVFKGSVIGPTFHFDVPHLKFGTISYGFIHTKICTLYNTALVPMTFHLRVPGDGIGESICSTSECDSNLSESGSSVPPKEFVITPSSGTLQPQSDVQVKIDLCSNTLKKYDLSLVVAVDGVGEEVLVLPITAKCIVPQITVLTPILDYGRCFLRHPYEHHVRLQNDTDLPAKYELVPQQIDQFTSIIYTSPQPKGIIEPHSVMEVPLVITPQGIEELETTCYFSIFGSPDRPMPIHIGCIGEGPVVHIMPMSLDWGQIPVLVDHPKIVRLSNESLIPARFTTHMVRPHSMWRIEPESGEIAPEDQLELTVIACADDCVRFQDKVQINFVDGPSRTIPVTAYGHGTTIVTDPPMSPVLNLGPHFSKGPCKRTFTLTNRGRRHQSLVWSTEGFGFKHPRGKKHGTLQPLSPKDMKYKDSHPPPEPKLPIFSLTPYRMELNPGESIDVLLEGIVDEPRVVKERMLCHAIIGRAGGKELIMKVQINCEFISPLLQFSADRLQFRVDKAPDDELSIQKQELQLTNIASLPLTAILDLKHPFALVADEENNERQILQNKELYLGIGEMQTVKIQFDPAYKDDSHIRIAEDVLSVTYKEHPHTDTIALKGEVYFPNVQFEKTVIDFGCILNDTEVTRYVNMTNNSPMDVHYKWSFLLDDEPVITFNRPVPPPVEDEEPLNLEELDEEQPQKEEAVEEQQQEEEEKQEEGKNESADTEELHVTVEIEAATATPSALSQPLIPTIQQPDSEESREADDDEVELKEATESHPSDERIVTPEKEPSPPSTPKSLPPINPTLAALLQQSEQPEEDLGVEEVFDILPLYGTLKPGETEQMTLTFYGHAHIGSKAKAICEVEGGPTYEIILKGEASLVQYGFDCLDIDYGKIMYDQIGTAEITLMNTGRVGFEFVALGMDPGMVSKPKPGIPVMIPHAGFIEADSQQTLLIKFLPGIPEKFHKSFQIQVAHFEPDTVNLLGEGVFPRISLDLPRSLEDDGQYEALVKEVREQLTTETKKTTARPVSAVSQQGNGHGAVVQDQMPSDLEIQLEVERIVVQEFAQEMYAQQNVPDVLNVHNDGTAMSTTSSKGRRKKTPKPKARLPPYLLDFGHVVLGTVRTHIVRATNTGWFPASFSINTDYLYEYGFSIELDRVKNLPGAPDHETVDFEISFDPRGANLGLGEVATVVPINIVGGPQVLIQLRANVTMPDMQISTDVLQFDEVKCGECKVMTVQLYNHQHVPCEWNSIPTEKESAKYDKHVPMHLRRKVRPDKPKPRTFEMMPPYSILNPGQRQNVQVKFMPTEEKLYEQRISIRLAQSSQRIILMCRGQGLEPNLEFERSLVEFGPVLPHSAGDEQDIVIKNPCKFPLEVYNLEFDRTYLEDEKILRLMKGYDEYNTILLPPRNPGEKLPQELLDYYEEQKQKLSEQEQARQAAEAAEAAKQNELSETKSEAEKTETEPTSKPVADSGENTDGNKTEHSEEKTVEESRKESGEEVKEKDNTTTVGDLEITPVSQAIARHLGIDLSPEGKAARNRRGIAVIVHGAPRSGKTATAVALAKRYEAALLTVNGVVSEAIANGNTPAGRKARQLCAEAAHSIAEEQRALDGECEVPDKKATSGGLSVEAVAAHTQGTGLSIGQVAAAQSVAHSLVSNRKTSTISDQKSKDKHHGSTIGGKPIIAASSNEMNSQVPSSPPPLMAPVARRLSISASVAGDEGLVSCVLPDELLIEILAERLMLNDCHRGVVFDSLDTLFSQNYYTTANCILKALNNRKYLYFITLKLDYNMMKEQERKRQQEQERARAEAEEAERCRLEEMSEDEYDALTEEEKANVDRKRLEIKKERLRREMEERLERERREREKEEAEALRLAEEKQSKKKKKGPEAKETNKKGPAGKAAETGRATAMKSQDGKKGHDGDHGLNKSASGVERPDSHGTDRDTSAADDNKKRKDKSKDGKRPISNEDRKGKCEKGSGQDGDEEPQKEQKSEEELLLIQRFRTFEHSVKDIENLVSHWERSTGMIRPSTPSDGAGPDNTDEGHMHPPSGRKTKKDKHDKVIDKKVDKSKDKDQAPSTDAQLLDSADGQSEALTSLTEEEKKEKRLEDGIGIPNIIIDCANKDDSVSQYELVTASGKLPSVEEVLDGLGLGPKGPPIPPPALFAVVPYPVKRHAPPGAESGHYMFVASSADDPNIGRVEERAKEDEGEEEKSATPDGHKEEHTTPTRGKGKPNSKLASDTKKDRGRQTSARSRAGRRSSTMTSSPPPGPGPSAPTPVSETDGSATDIALFDPKTPRLTLFRWVIPAEGQVTLRLRFMSDELGQFDQTLNFEIVGTRRRYQLYCRGICAFPTISREPRIIFPHRKKNKKPDEIVHKKYILTTEIFEFGPLLVGKSRDKYKEGKYPENMEQITIKNSSPVEADISFCFLHDSKADTYLLDPPTMQIQPGQSQELRIWAYPKAPGTYEDALVCCVKENPEPIIFKLICYGVRPELELDKKTLQFDKVLLHRKDTKTLYLRNSTLLPVAWRLNGLENLGDDFSVSQESGIIEPKSEFALHAYFRAMKPVNTNRKTIRLEVSDVDNIMGLVQTESIQVHAEAYDVALDMSFPKGADGGIDFDVIRVSDKHTQACSLKNKGKYEIAFQFVFEPTDQCPKELCNMFIISQQRGNLLPTDRPTQVSISFQSDKEVTIKEQPILRCQVIEPSLSEDGETIASIPIKLSVRAVFSKYNIYPVNDINFAAMVVGHKKTRLFVLENKGDRFEFKYTITKMQRKEEVKQDDRRSRPAIRGSDKRSKSRDGSSSGRSGARPKRAESNSEWDMSVVPQSTVKPSETDKKRKQARPDAGGVAQSRLVLGMYNIYPAVGTIFPGGHQQITVECLAENPGRYEEELAIDITGRDPNDHPYGIPYKLIAEACIPGIDVTDIGSIFEEHHICKNLSVWQHSHTVESGGVYGEDENRFVFNNVLVGSKAKARFKISNTNKVPCVVVFSVKQPAMKHSTKNQQDVFEVEPQKTEIAARGFIYATVTFTPISMQYFTATFEAAVEVSAQSQVKGRSLTFEVVGEGNLPRISILKPIVRNKKGQPLLLFKRNLIGKDQTLPLHLVNDGTLPSKVDIDLIDPDSCFTLTPTGNTQAVNTVSSIDDAKRKPHTASVIVNIGESAKFDVTFRPKIAQRSQGSIHLTVVNNQYEDSVIQLVGEGYEDEISLDNIHSVMLPVDPEHEEGCMADDDVPAAKNNQIRFGDCFVNEPRTLSFSMTNHSKMDCVRFEWPEHPQLKFSPQTGHIHAGRSKDISVTFRSDTPQTLDNEVVNCKVVKITFDKPIQEVADWDDRVKTVKWIDVPVQATAAPSVDGSQKDKPSTPQPATLYPIKKKVIETEPEPPHTELPDTVRMFELIVSALADYCKYKCKVERIHFRDTLVLQTRVYEFQLSNKGQVSMEYNMQLVSEAIPPTSGLRSISVIQEESRPPTAAGLVVPDSRIRPGSGASSMTSDVPYVPFSVEPENGKILPGKKSTITVKFSPLDVNEFEGKLVCSIPNLEEGKEGPVITVLGRSLLPYCHFDLEDSDYLRSARRNPELRGPNGAPPGTTLDPNTRVIEFNTVGMDVRQTKMFSIVNPTNQNYSFQWVNEDETNHKKEPNFRCLVPEGRIKSGKKCEVGFEFHSSSLELTESFWRFVIPEQDISVPFLLVGNTTEPSVMLEKSHLNFKSLLIGHEAEEVIHMTNNEDQAFHFAFEESSLYCAGYSAGLVVDPAAGTIPAKSTIPIHVRFVPNSDKEVNFNLVCNVKKKTMPLTLNVKAEGYTMDCIVMCEQTSGGKQELNSNAINQIKFGDVEVNEKSVRNISIVNCGKFNFDYSWELEERPNMADHMVNISPLNGGVMHGERKICQLSFCPTRATNLRACQLLLKISNGPMYVLQVFGNGVLPGLHFSYPSHNFGPCFIHRAGLPVNSTVLKITNTDKKEISVDCLYQPTSHLHHDFEAQVIAPGQSVDVNFTFYPREPKKYRELVIFEVNGLSRRSVEFIGLGTEMKVEVADPKQKIVKLGALRLGQSVKKIVPVVNRSPAAIEFQLAITPSSHALQEHNVLRLSPTGNIQLDPKGGQTKVEIVFCPKTRIPQFTEEVLLECAGLHQPLFVVQGSCQGIEISLDSDAVPFGAVVKKSSSSRNVIMTNTGDIGAKIRWDVKKFAPDFSISPQEGYISPGMEIPFEITFHPQEVNSDIRYDNLKCFVEGSKPLKLTLTGTCVDIPPSRDAVHFTTYVRHKETKNVIVQNRTNVSCTIRPIIDGEYWSGADTFLMEPSSSKPYEVSYKPLTMTLDNKKHQGSIFFPFPDGTGQMFMLTGTAEAPKATAKITKEIPCKTLYTELLSVQNWLKKPQRFRVKTEMIKPDKLDPGTTLKGLDYIDVPGNSRRDYKLTYYAHKEGQSQFKIVFINEQTQEYQFFDIVYKSTRPGTISTIELTTPVRQSVPYTITIENPLSYQVTFSVSCTVPEIQMPSQLHVSAQNEGQFNFEYLPLKVGEVQGRLELSCNDLGLYTYDLSLKATPAGPERALYFRTGLGTNQIQVAKFLNFAKQKTDYTCKVDNTDFHVDKTVVAAPGSTSGTEVAMEVNYEPSHIGESRALLTVASPIGGEYTFPLFGTCIPPKPQGPFNIRAGSTTSITFRNVFPHTTGFTFQVDNPLFHVTKPGENIRAHKDHRIVVGFDGNDSGSKATVMGKLIVSCAKSAGGTTSAQWVYYLKGFTPER